MALSGPQTRQLRSLAHHLNPVIIVGKAGVNEGTAQQAREALDAHELIKCSVLDSAPEPVRDAAHDLAERCGAEVVQVIGRRFSLYRRSERDGVEHIELA